MLIQSSLHHILSKFRNILCTKGTIRLLTVKIFSQPNKNKAEYARLKGV